MNQAGSLANRSISSGMDTPSRKFDFIVVGFPKCGTTALVDQLERHPAIHIARRDKTQHGNDFEIHFFDDDTKDERWLHDLLDPEAQSNGYKTVNYIYNKGTLEKIKAYCPDIKIIICIRPVRYAVYSWFKMHKSIAAKPNSLHTVNRTPEARQEFLNISFDEYVEKRIIKLNYANYIKNAIALFGESSIHIVEQGDLAENAYDTLSSVCRYLGMESMERDRILALNKNLLSKWEGYEKSINAGLDEKKQKQLHTYQKKLDALLKKHPGCLNRQVS